MGEPLVPGITVVSSEAVPRDRVFLLGAPIRMEIRPSADGCSYDVRYVWPSRSVGVIRNLESGELRAARNRRQRKNPARTTWGHQRP